jgi:hypothetical protein
MLRVLGGISAPSQERQHLLSGTADARLFGTPVRTSPQIFQCRLTGNIILSYNLLFLSTFMLSGLGMFLFVRGSDWQRRAGFAAG